MKRIEELYRDFPDEARERRAPARAPVPGFFRRGPAASVLLAAVLVLLGAAAVLLPRPRERRGTASFLRQLSIAIDGYRADWGAWPAGDGKGSAELAGALCRPGRRGSLPPVVSEEQRDARGNLRAPDGSLVRYRAPGEVLGRPYDLWIDTEPR